MDTHVLNDSRSKTAVSYRKGLHIVVDGTGVHEARLVDFEGFRAMVERRIQELGLTAVGAVHHVFAGGGYTSVVCLTESHLSIHTWPEHGRVTFDVFLSNFSKDNDRAGSELAKSIMDFLGHGEFQRTELRR